MSKEKIYQCRYSKCLYDTKDIQPDDDCIVNKTHYHKKCYEYKSKIAEIADYYYNHISKTVVYGQLVRTINNIVFNKNVDPKFLLFAIQFSVKNGAKIKSPFYLHYLIDKDEIKRAYNQQVISHKPKVDIDSIKVKEEQSFTYKPKSKKGFGKIID